MKRPLIVKALEPVQPGRRETGQHGGGPGPEQRRAHELPAGQRARLGDDDAAAGLLPAAGCDLPAELASAQELEYLGRAEDAFPRLEYLVQPLIVQAHALSVIK